MTTEEKRRHYRIDSQNLLNYASFDESGNLARQGMGRTLNVSKTGILLETHVELESGNNIELTIGLEEDLLTIQGKIVYVKPGQEGKFESGIQFFDVDPSSDKLLQRYIESFRAQ
jgi:hypothetical protein